MFIFLRIATRYLFSVVVFMIKVISAMLSGDEYINKLTQFSGCQKQDSFRS